MWTAENFIIEGRMRPLCTVALARPGVPNLGYIFLSEGVHLRLAVEEKNIVTYCLFPNIYTYISEYYFQNHYMLIVKYIRE